MFWRHALSLSSTQAMIGTEQIFEALAQLIAWEYFTGLMLMCGLQYRVCLFSAHRSQMQSLPSIYSQLDLKLQIQECMY